MRMDLLMLDQWDLLKLEKMMRMDLMMLDQWIFPFTYEKGKVV